jgi:hypothetical protein
VTVPSLTPAVSGQLTAAIRTAALRTGLDLLGIDAPDQL